MSTTSSRRGARRRLIGAGLALASATLMLAGCSDSASTGSGSDDSATLRVAVPFDITLPTILRFQATNQPLRRNVFEYVFDRDADGTIQPYLGTDYEWSEDGKSLVINLRDDVKFHNGRAFTAADVIATIEAAKAPESGAQAAKLMAQATSIKASGEHQITATFNAPAPHFLDGLTMLPIIDSTTYADLATGKQVIGTGPFVFDSWEAGRSLELKRNEDYWRADAPSVAGVSYDIIPEPQALLAAVRSGSVDLAMRVIPRDAATLASNDDFKIGTTEPYEIYLGTNTEVKPLNDVRVRQAISYAADRDRIADQVFKGYATPSSVPWAPGTPGVSDEQINHYERDLDKAKQLIEEAGAKGAEVEIAALASEPVTNAVLEIVQYNLEEIGLKPVVKSPDPADFQKTLQEAAFGGLWITDVALTAMGQPTALLSANPLLVGSNSENFTAPKYGELVNKLVTAPEDGAAAASTELTDYLLEQSFHISLAQQHTVFVHAANVSGVRADLTLALDLSDVKVG